MQQQNPDRIRKGRGAVSNASGRYERLTRETFDDGWDSGTDADDPPLRTRVTADRSRSIIARNSSPDVPFDRSINPYRGCEHGCIYCFARPTHAWLGLSPGLDFETRLFVKRAAAALLRRELARKSYTPRPLAMGTNTDPYQPLERKERITRGVLEVLAEHRHPVTIVTKSDLVLRDLDILAPMAEANLARVTLSVTTLDRTLARKLEPRAPTAAKRLAAIAGLKAAGIPTGVLAAPMIPALNDAELEAILQAAQDAGARWAGYVLLRLPLEIKELFSEWLDANAPGRKDYVLNLVRDTRDGRLYDSTWGRRQRGSGVYADLLAKRFSLACRKLGLNGPETPLDIGAFRVPAAAPDPQLSLF